MDGEEYTCGCGPTDGLLASRIQKPRLSYFLAHASIGTVFATSLSLVENYA